MCKQLIPRPCRKSEREVWLIAGEGGKKATVDKLLKDWKCRESQRSYASPRLNIVRRAIIGKRSRVPLCR